MEQEIFKFYIDTRNVVGRGGIKGFVYEVSNYGRVKANGVVIEPRGETYKEFGHHYSVHRAVAKLFVPNPENKPFVDHIDTNPSNNRADNLRWVTSKENSNNVLTKKHMSESRKGIPSPRKGKEPWNKGKQMSEESKHLMSINGKGKHSKEGRLNIGRKSAERRKGAHRVWNAEHTRYHYEKS